MLISGQISRFRHRVRDYFRYAHCENCPLLVTETKSGIPQDCALFDRIPLIIDKAAGTRSFCAATSKGLCAKPTTFALTS